MRFKYLSVLAAVVGSMALAAAGCSDDDGSGVREIGSGSSSASASGSSSGSESASGSVAAECEPVGDVETADTVVGVTLDEWVIETDAPNAPAGALGFSAENIGEEPHELVVVSRVDPTDLPLDDDGALDEEALPAGALIGEIEPFPAGDSCDGVFDLEPAEYTLICNIAEVEEDGTVESHLAEGMVTTFTVE